MISERIKLQREIKASLKQATKLKKEASSSIQKALETLSQLERKLRAFNAQHPLFCKFIWVIDHHFTFKPLQREINRLNKEAKIPETKQFLNERLSFLKKRYFEEKRTLRECQFNYYPELVKTVIRQKIRAYKKQYRLVMQAEVALNYKPQIADLPICSFNPSERIAESEYEAFIQNCRKGVNEIPALFLPYATESLEKIREYSRSNRESKAKIQETLLNVNAQALVRLRIKLT